jgi:poly-beta-1,6-N-acetyl-D-glucosamine synthase
VSNYVDKNHKNRYVLITPVKDEAKYIKETLESVMQQTVKPCKWIIIDDGSKDDTSQIVREYVKFNDWIKLITANKSTARYPGYPVVSAFILGYNSLDAEEYDFIVKLDGDLKFSEDYFEKLICKFNSNDRLGIASGVYLEKVDERWEIIDMPGYHAAGASKFIRKECFIQIDGFLPSLGWDTLDEIKARARGWETGHFSDIPFYHLKKEGSGIGALRTCVVHGRIFYLTGGKAYFFIIKAIKRMIVDRPPVIKGMLMAWGFFKAALLREKRLVNSEEALLYNKLLAERLSSKTKAFFG